MAGGGGVGRQGRDYYSQPPGYPPSKGPQLQGKMSMLGEARTIEPSGMSA